MAEDIASGSAVVSRQHRVLSLPKPGWFRVLWVRTPGGIPVAKMPAHSWAAQDCLLAPGWGARGGIYSQFWLQVSALECPRVRSSLLSIPLQPPHLTDTSAEFSLLCPGLFF